MNEPKVKAQRATPKRKVVIAAIRPWVMKVNGIPVEVVGLAELSALSGKSKITLRQWETKGWLPLPNMRSPLKGKQTIGARLYTFETAKKMAECIKKAEAGVEVSLEIKQTLLVLLKEERQRLSNATA